MSASAVSVGNGGDKVGGVVWSHDRTSGPLSDTLKITIEEGSMTNSLLKIVAWMSVESKKVHSHHSTTLRNTRLVPRPAHFVRYNDNQKQLLQNLSRHITDMASGSKILL